MTVTLTTQYKEVLQTETVELIEQLLEDCHDLQCMLEFIDENSEKDFVQYYEEYVIQGEKVGYDVVDAFIQENGIDQVESTEDAFVGEYSSVEEFAEQFYDDMGAYIPDGIIVDWKATWEHSLGYSFDYVDGYVFRTHY
jgi:regulator of RNase E activity RraB